jgi:hypothetical protein
VVLPFGPVDPADEGMLTDILTRPRDALLRQYQRLFAMEGSRLEATPDGLAAILAAALPLQSSDLPSPTPPLSNPENPSQPYNAPEPPNAPLLVGDRAPDFSWQSEDARLLKLPDLLAQGHLLVVFGAPDAVLRALEHERTSLLDLGVVPIAVVSSGNRGARATASRLGLHYVPCPIRGGHRRAVRRDRRYGRVDRPGVVRRPQPGCVRALKRCAAVVGLHATRGERAGAR